MFLISHLLLSFYCFLFNNQRVKFFADVGPKPLPSFLTSHGYLKTFMSPYIVSFALSYFYYLFANNPRRDCTPCGSICRSCGRRLLGFPHRRNHPVPRLCRKIAGRISRLPVQSNIPSREHVSRRGPRANISPWRVPPVVASSSRLARLSTTGICLPPLPTTVSPTGTSISRFTAESAS